MISFIFMFFILQWNARSLIANGQEFKKYVDGYQNKLDLICVQETWLKACLDFVMPGYVCIRKDRLDTGGGGCATFIKAGIQYKVVDHYSSVECVITQIWSAQGKISVVNLYNPCKLLTMEELDGIMEKVESPVIWVGDFNGHNPLWGSKKMDRNGMVIEEL